MKTIFELFLVKLICLILCFCLILDCDSALAKTLSDKNQNTLVASSSKIIEEHYPTFNINTQYLLAGGWGEWWCRVTNRRCGDLPQGPEGITRGDCNALSQDFVAIVPSLENPNQFPNLLNEENTDSNKPLFGLTTYQSPTLWFYVPKLIKANKAELMLQIRENGQNRDVLEQVIPINDLPRDSGIWGINLESVTDLPIVLEPNKLYGWYLSLVCNDKRPSRNPSVSGWIAYEPDFDQTTLDMLSNRQRISRYKADEIWHDALTLSAKLRCNGAGDTDWIELVESIGFDEEMAMAEIQQCSTIF